MRQRLKQNNDGSALMVAIVAGVVVMTFSLMLLMVSYSLFSTATGQQSDMTARELSQSIADELTQEIIGVSFASAEAQEDYEGNLNNSSSISGLPYRLWFFLRYNVWQKYYWPPINDDTSSYSKYKYFRLNNDQGPISLVEDVTVRFSWESPSTVVNIKDDTKLYMTVAVKDKGVVYETTRTFSLYTNLSDYLSQDETEEDEKINLDDPENIEDWEINVNEEDDLDKPIKGNPEDTHSCNNPEINPNNLNILKYEKWSWSLE